MSDLNKWKLVDLAIQKQLSRILLYGPPGTGKTSVGMSSTGSEKSKARSITLHEEYSPAEMIGMYVPEGQKFVFQDGPALLAMQEGCRLILNEIDHASIAAMSILLQILDDQEVLTVETPDGRTIKPQPGFSVIATMNGNPNMLPTPILDRFEAKICIQQPHPGIYESLPTYFCEILSGSYENSQPPFSSREIMSINKLIKRGIEPEVAIQIVLPEEKQEGFLTLYLAKMSG